MIKVLRAYLFTSLVASFVFGPMFVFAFVVMLVICLVLATPLLLLFRRLNWLRWWHSTLAGVVCALPVLYFDLGNNEVRAAVYGPSNVVGLLSVGAACGLIFWCAGLRGNDKFPNAGDQTPKTMLVMLPVAIGAAMAYLAFQPDNMQGRLISVSNTNQGKGTYPTAKVLLSDGTEVSATVLDTRPAPALSKVCVNMTSRKSLTFIGKDYWVDYFLDKPFRDFDKC